MKNIIKDVVVMKIVKTFEDNSEVGFGRGRFDN